MSDEKPNEIIEIAKAVKETAKTTSDAISIVQNTGGFLNKVFGDLVENSVGIVADKIKFYRINNFINLSKNTTHMMRQKGFSEDDITKVVPLKVAVPLIENATLEDDAELQKLWAQMLANAMDPKFSIDIKLRHISLLREMEPLDLRILNTCYLTIPGPYKNNPLEKVLFEKLFFIQNFSISENRIEVSLLNLMRLGCLKSGNIETPLSFGNEPNTINMGTRKFSISQLGVELCKAAMTY